MNYSILRYPGGKTSAVNELKKHIPLGTQEIMSPFFGGGSFEFYCESVGIKVYGYDNYDLLVNFWSKIRENREEVYKNLPKKVDSEEFYAMQKAILEEKDDYKRASMFFILNGCSFAGTTLSGGMSPNHPRYTENSRKRLRRFKTNISVRQMSFEESIKNHNCLVYADPPYLIKDNLYGTKGNMHEGFNHDLLAEILNGRGNFILSYNDCDEIKEKYKNHTIHYPRWTYGMGNDRDSREVLIISNDVEEKKKESGFYW